MASELWNHDSNTPWGYSLRLWDDGDLEVESDDLSHVFPLTPADAVNLASALLQYATQNASWWKAVEK